MMKRMIDLHQHVIHGMDDGAQCFEHTKAMLRTAAKEGLSGIISTPHAVPGRIFFDMPLYLANLQMAQEWCSKNSLNMNLYPGAEILYTENTLRMLDERRIPTLNHTRYVLIEFPVTAAYDQLLRAAGQLVEADYQPVFAHVERYRSLNSPDRLRKLRDKFGVLMQMNASSVLDEGGFWRKRRYRFVLQSGLIDVVASDAHNTGCRSCCLGAAYEWLAVKCGIPTAQRCCVESPLQIISNR